MSGYTICLTLHFLATVQLVRNTVNLSSTSPTNISGSQPNSSKWITFGGCGVHEILDQHLTKTVVEKILRDWFFQSIYQPITQKNLLGCSRHCLSESAVNNFIYWKTICQCIETLDKYPLINFNSTSNECIDLSSCGNLNEDFCPNGKGIPFYLIVKNVTNEEDSTIPETNILSSRCYVKKDEHKDYQELYKGACSNELRNHPCDFRRIMFYLDVNEYVEWSCQRINSSTQKYFRILTYTKGTITMSSIETATTDATNFLINNNRGEIHPIIWYNAIIISLVLIISLALCIFTISVRQKPVVIQYTRRDPLPRPRQPNQTSRASQYDMIHENINTCSLHHQALAQTSV